MSLQNKKTLNAYQKAANQYLVNNIKQDTKEVEKANKELHEFIKSSFSSINKGSKILEIGSADGENAKYIQSLGYDVVASDVADDFIKTIKTKDIKTIKFNVLEDVFQEKYSGIFCWKVFVHFTDKDILNVLEKTYNALEENGILVFNVISRETKNVKEEWIDFPGEYSIGIDRYFRYFYKEEIDKLIKQSKYKLVTFKEEFGIEKQKWLVYVLKKGSEQNRSKYK